MEEDYIGGENERGEPHGRGICYFLNGDRYEGQWKDGKLHGGQRLSRKTTLESW